MSHCLEYTSMKEDPKYLITLLQQYVKVDCIKNVSYNGFIHAIDPITKTVILTIRNNNDWQTILIPDHAVQNITKTTAPENLIVPPSKKESESCSQTEVSARKSKLMAWFKKNLLPVTEGENIMVGNVSILPPYSVTDIYAQNPVVAMQIRNIMEKMPEDFKSLDV